MLVLLSGKPVRSDLEDAPVGAFDVIRDDIRQISTVKPVDRIFVERTDLGYRGVLFSHEKPYMFALNGNGFISKPLTDDTAVMAYCNRLEDGERRITSSLDAVRADAEMDGFNEEMQWRAPKLNTGDATAQREEGPSETVAVWGPLGEDPIERVPGAYRQIEQGASTSRLEGKAKTGVCGGGVVMNKEGKVLLVKPRNGYGGYDWTLPKGYPAGIDEGKLTQTAVREVREETGYRVFANRYLGRFTHNDSGVCDYWYCDVDSSKPVGKPDPFETADVKWCTLIEALELLNDDVDVRILSHANNLLPKLLIKGGPHSGVMVALHLPIKTAKKLAVKGGEEPSIMHITLAYLGKGLSEQQKKTAASVVRKFAGSIANGIQVTLGGVGRFSASESSEGRDVIYLSVDSPALTKLRPRLMDMLADAGITAPESHGFVPHVTLAYVKKTEKTPIERLEPIELNFDTISLTIADKRMSFPLKTDVQKSQWKDKLHGGKADKKKPSDFDAEQLAIGVKHEMEHTNDKRVAREIAMDHLTEDASYYQKLKQIEKALPRLSDEEREAKSKPVGAKPGGASKKQMGAGGKTRYTYPGEKANAAPGAGETQGGGGGEDVGGGGAQQPQEQALPHPDTPHPQPEQAPIAAEHPEKPPIDDPRAPHPQEAQQPKHTVNLGELCAALNIQRSVLQQIVERMQRNFGQQARSKFISFMQTQMKDFVQEHGLEGDYFGLVFDVLTGKVQEGQPASQPQDEVAKKPASVQ